MPHGGSEKDGDCHNGSVKEASKNDKLNRLLQQCDKTQVEGLDDLLIAVNEDDRPIGPITKLQAHLLNTLTYVCPLHRAFSLFIFDRHSHRLLLQKRSSKKITFPNCWTNSCCSHPNYTDAELVESGQLGIKRAAIRRAKLELNIAISSVDIIHYICKVHYKARSVGSQGDMFGEHEIDYILFAQLDLEEMRINPNLNEVSTVCLVTIDEVKQLLERAAATNDTNDNKVSPWFRMIASEFLFDHWPTTDRPCGVPVSMPHIIRLQGSDPEEGQTYTSNGDKEAHAIIVP